MSDNTKDWITILASTIGPFAGVVIGLVAGYWLELRREDREEKRRRRERAAEFRREKLLEIHTLLDEYSTLNYEIFDQKWRNVPVDPTLDPRALRVAARLYLVGSLLGDAETRKLIKNVVDQTHAVGQTTSPNAAFSALIELTGPGAAVDRLSDRIAGLLRGDSSDKPSFA